MGCRGEDPRSQQVDLRFCRSDDGCRVANSRQDLARNDSNSIVMRELASADTSNRIESPLYDGLIEGIRGDALQWQWNTKVGDQFASVDFSSIHPPKVGGLCIVSKGTGFCFCAKSDTFIPKLCSVESVKQRLIRITKHESSINKDFLKNVLFSHLIGPLPQ